MDSSIFNNQGNAVELRMTCQAYREMICHIASQPSETGGILLGPIGSDDITDFSFDEGAVCSGATYSPNHVLLQQHMNEEWLPSGIDMKGFAHSHPSKYDRLSPGDLSYIKRLLLKNADMEQFAAPIILPQWYCCIPFVVLRSEPLTPRVASLVLF